MIALFNGARIVVFCAPSSKRCDSCAKSRVKPAKMLMERSEERTSERKMLWFVDVVVGCWSGMVGLRRGCWSEASERVVNGRSSEII